MHLHDVIGWRGPMTHRQYIAWQQWLRDDWNRPNRSDHYTMQATQQAIAPHLKEGATLPDLKDFVLKFGTGEEAAAEPEDLSLTDGPPIVTDEMIARFNRERSMMAMGIDPKKVEHRWVDRDGNPVKGPDVQG